MSVGISQSVYRPSEKGHAVLIDDRQEPDTDPLAVFRGLFFCLVFDVIIGLGILAGWLLGVRL